MFKKWLRKLYGLLAPGGILVFSVHDQAVLPSGVAMPVTGFFFQPHSESGSLDKNQYGSTWVTEDFVRKVIVEITGRAVYARGRRALYKHQDVYLVANGEHVIPSDYRMAWDPRDTSSNVPFYPPPNCSSAVGPLIYRSVVR